MDIVDKLVDLHKQATTERSHYYVANTVMEAVQEIHKLRSALAVIAAQDSGRISSTDRADCMAAIAKATLIR